MSDTLSIARKLIDAGLKREQAEAIVDAIHESQAEKLGHLATKAELYRALCIQGAGVVTIIVSVIVGVMRYFLASTQ